VIVPPSPGVLCAFGDATTRLRSERARSMTKTFGDVDDATVKAVLAELAEDVTKELESEGVARADIEVSLEAGVRYSGQAFEVALPVALTDFGGEGLKKLGDTFDSEHERSFTFKLDTDRELVSLRATALGKASVIKVEPIPAGNGDPAGAKIRDHKMWCGGVEMDGAIYDRAKLKAGDRIVGPAIVSEMDSTTVVFPDHVAEVDPFGLILIRPI
jgi:N-methylhydantoinase A